MWGFLLGKGGWCCDWLVVEEAVVVVVVVVVVEVEVEVEVVTVGISGLFPWL